MLRLMAQASKLQTLCGHKMWGTVMDSLYHKMFMNPFLLYFRSLRHGTFRSRNWLVMRCPFHIHNSSMSCIINISDYVPQLHQLYSVVSTFVSTVVFTVVSTIASTGAPLDSSSSRHNDLISRIYHQIQSCVHFNHLRLTIPHNEMLSAGIL